MPSSSKLSSCGQAVKQHEAARCQTSGQHAALNPLGPHRQAMDSGQKNGRKLQVCASLNEVSEVRPVDCTLISMNKTEPNDALTLVPLRSGSAKCKGAGLSDPQRLRHGYPIWWSSRSFALAQSAP
mmetsp:Transcript_74675/g.124585  ORF Transcript_74675/g.124585 Transcript_74675/m.124585 type:complete len:126 (+) Transcript_74675:287-664(+)